jgi:hypothetical protein
VLFKLFKKFVLLPESPLVTRITTWTFMLLIPYRIFSGAKTVEVLLLLCLSVLILMIIHIVREARRKGEW